MRTPRWLVSGGLLSLLAGSIACGVGDPSAHMACTTAQDCNPGRYCVARRCQDQPLVSPDASIDLNQEEASPADLGAPARLTLAAMPPGSATFGDVVLGDVRDQTFVLTNAGEDPTSVIDVALGGAASSGFALLDAGAGDCISGITTLSPGGTCDVHVRFAPTDAGAHSASLGASAAIGGSPSPLDLTGTGLRPAHLSGTIAHDFGTEVIGGMGDVITWTVQNDGDVATGALALASDNPGELIVDANGCRAGIDPGASCSIQVSFHPSASGPRKGTVTVQDAAGDSVSFSATAIGESAAELAVESAPGSPSTYGDVVVGWTAERAFVVINKGPQESSPLNIALTPDIGPGFAVVSNDPDRCVSGVTSLAGGDSCTITVRFSPLASGRATATLSVQANAGGAVSVDVEGTARDAVALAALSGATAVDFGTLDIGGPGPNAFRWTITNVGDFATSVPILTASGSSEVIVLQNGCQAALAPGAACAIDVTFQAAVGGFRSGALVLSASPGGSLELAVTAAVRFRLTVTKTGMGDIPGLSCGPSCSETVALFDPSSYVDLFATTANGSGWFFAGWGAVCSGMGNCLFIIDADTTLTATFLPMNNNLVFFAGPASTDLGGASAYDGLCNDAATKYGINDERGTAYVAFVSDSNSLVSDRLGAARGWIRRDGRPFADTLDSLFANKAMFNQVGFYASGLNPQETTHNSSTYLTGIKNDGSVSTTQSCGDWTGAASNQVLGGFVDGEPSTWTGVSDGRPNPCRLLYDLLCMGKSSSAPVAPVVSAGRKIWMSNTPFIPGGSMTPDAQCQAEIPAGVTTAAALIAYTTKPASVHLDPTTKYVRPDETLVGTGAQIASGGRLESGIWQSADGRYRGGYVWTGQTDLNTPGTAASTCADWADATLTAATVGTQSNLATYWWQFYRPMPCKPPDTLPASLYCVQTAP